MSNYWKEEQNIDPAFQREQSDFPVEDVSVAAAVANAQSRNLNQLPNQINSQISNQIPNQVPNQLPNQLNPLPNQINPINNINEPLGHGMVNSSSNPDTNTGTNPPNKSNSTSSSGSGEGEGEGAVPANSPKLQSPDTASSYRNRPVSGTKRAAQNRSAQKAFRQRKDRYVKELEQLFQENKQLKQTIEELRAENLQLRDYTIMLQSRIIEYQPNNLNQNHEVPAPPVMFNNKIFNPEKPT